jgi:long-chain-fatty-acid--CoA ligase ACSBG
MTLTHTTLPKLPEDEQAVISKEGMQYILDHFDPSQPERNFLWTTDYRVELPLRIKKTGKGSE